jgi:hypothetical protein
MKALYDYGDWFAATEECVGKSKPYYRIRWFVIDSAVFQCGDVRAIACFDSPNSIILSRDWMDEEETVRHEIIHYLIQPTPAHPEPPFEKCEYT